MQQLDCVACTVHQCAVFLKEKLLSVMSLIASTFVEIRREQRTRINRATTKNEEKLEAKDVSPNRNHMMAAEG